MEKQHLQVNQRALVAKEEDLLGSKAKSLEIFQPKRSKKEGAVMMKIMVWDSALMILWMEVVMKGKMIRKVKTIFRRHLRRLKVKVYLAKDHSLKFKKMIILLTMIENLILNQDLISSRTSHLTK